MISSSEKKIHWRPERPSKYEENDSSKKMTGSFPNQFGLSWRFFGVKAHWFALLTYYIALFCIAEILEGSLLLFKLIRPVPIWHTLNLQPQCPLGAGWQCVSAVCFTCRQRAAAILPLCCTIASGEKVRVLAACIRRPLAGWNSYVMLSSPTAIYLYLFTFWNWQHPISLVIPQSTAECLVIWLLAVTVVYSYMLK